MTSLVTSGSYANSPLTLLRVGWTDPVVWAALAFFIVNTLVVVYCLILVARRPWLQENGSRANNKYLLFVFAGIMALVGLVIDEVNIILHAVEVTTTYSYYVVYIFRQLGYRTADVLLIGVLYQVIDDARAAWLAPITHRKLRIFHLCLIIVLSILSAAGLALYVRWVTMVLVNDDYITPYLGPLELARVILAFLMAVEILVFSVYLSVKKAISKHNRWLLLIASTALFIYTAITIVDVVRTSLDLYLDYDILPWVCVYIGSITSITIFLGLALLSRQSNKTIHDIMLSNRFSKFGSHEQGIIYSSPSPYALQPHEISGYQYDSASRSVHSFGQQGQRSPDHELEQPVSPIPGAYHNGTGYVPVSMHEMH